MFQVYFEYIKNYFKYTLNLFLKARVFLTQKYKVDFQNLCIYCQTQKYT